MQSLGKVVMSMPVSDLAFVWSEAWLVILTLSDGCTHCCCFRLMCGHLTSHCTSLSLSCGYIYGVKDELSKLITFEQFLVA